MGFSFGGKPLSDTLSWNNSYVKNQLATGTLQTDEGLNDLRGLAGTYQGYINAGGLTPDLVRQFAVQKGQLSDQYTRSGRSLNAALAQRRLQSGGQLSPEAIAEMEKEGTQTSDEQYYGASNNLAMQQANMSFDATKDWYGRIQSIADTIRSTGLTREQAAMAARLQLAGLAQQRRLGTAQILGKLL